MRWVYQTAVVVTCLLVTAPALASDWVKFTNETSKRLVADSSLGANDTQEKDYAWGDVDQDGDIDLVVVRKQPFTTTGKRVNVLFLNEGGVLIDRTAQYASASDVPGDQGFLTPTNDRDVVLADVNNDGFLDIITAVTLTDNQGKHLSHPRVYINLGKDLDENWLGFEYQDARIPQMHPNAGPRFCSVAVGDVTGDGYADLYFGDYDTPIGNMLFDFNNRLLVNAGQGNPGFFADESTLRMGSLYNYGSPVGVQDYLFGAFGAASIIADLNGDGINDVVKQTSLNPPQHVAIVYNDFLDEGFFNFYDVVNSLAPYFVSAGDLNGDGRLDLVITDDGTDTYLLNTGNDANGHAQFSAFSFPNSGGFGSNSVIADLNNDTHNDVIIADVDVDIQGCTRRTFIYRNLGNVPNVSFQEQGQVIPNTMLLGVHDVAVFDINGDGWLDLVIGRCGGTQVWINQPPVSVTFGYPQGLPDIVPPGEPFAIQVELQPVGGSLEPGTEMIHVSTNRGSFVATPMEPQGRNIYTATLPASACLDTLGFYFSAQISGEGVFTDPITAPADFYSANVAVGLEITFQDEFEDDVSAWQVVNDPSLTAGAWEQADPNGTICCGGLLAAPDNDATPDPGVMAFVTENCQGAQCDTASATDVDGGPTHLISPAFDLDGTDAIIHSARWFFTDTGGTTDFFTVALSNDGGATWVPVPEHTTGSTQGTWESVRYLESNYDIPPGDGRVRSTPRARPHDSVTEA
ncbi:MAG: VCBS repeat-containing protein, partial [Planctomycetota bacterium]|nr:VCBS repeat-containing protein [Planctomycetota bacterium]